MNQRIKWILILNLVLGVYSLSAVCSKFAAKQETKSILFVLFYGLVLLLLALYALGWQQVIKHLPLTTAYANKAITVVWGIVLGQLIFGERITFKQFIAAGLIILGVVLYVRAEDDGDGN